MCVCVYLRALVSVYVQGRKKVNLKTCCQSKWACNEILYWPWQSISSRSHLLNVFSFSHTVYVNPHIWLLFSLLFHSYGYLQSVSQPSALQLLIALGVFNLSVLSACLIQFSPALSLSCLFFSFFFVIHCFILFRMNLWIQMDESRLAKQHKTHQVSLSGVYKMLTDSLQQ